MIEVLPSIRRPVGVVLALGLSAAALSGCGQDRVGIKKNKPAVILKHIYKDSYAQYDPAIGTTDFVDAQYDFLLRQCGRSGDTGADKQGCVEDTIAVSKETYDKFEDGESIVFDRDKYYTPQG